VAAPIPFDPAALVVALLLVQALLGGADTLINHELRARLPTVPGAASELRLHALRSSLYATLFLAFAFADWRGRWALVPLAVSLAEVATTARDTVVELSTRRIDAPERVLHALLLLNTGAYTLAIALLAIGPDALALVPPDPWRALLALAATGAAASALRDALAARRRTRSDADDRGAAARRIATAVERR
jgi:hypothetical protein